jgi:hypothetical protein
MMLRAHHKPLSDARAIHNVLASLQVGDPVPANILVLDYQDWTIPPWTVREREDHDILIILTVVDESNFKPVGLDICTCPAKTLASGKPFQYFPGCEHCRNMLTDMRQHARSMADTWNKTPRKQDVSLFWLESESEISV